MPTGQLYEWLADYLAREEVGDLVIGESLTEDGQPNPIQTEIVGFERKFVKLYPTIRLHRQDEFYSSRRAREVLLASGAKKKRRRDKREVDRIAAALILQDFMDRPT